MKWRYTPNNDLGLPQDLWRIKDLAKWLGVGEQNIYSHIHEGTLNPLAYTKFGRILVFFPWKCMQLLEDGELIQRGGVQHAESKNN